ncbi:hypothetical protein Scep_006374 [Stephania cephalantha]|uniref:Cytochrome P450 n=1 Tax=Stephania cephalantha TaxID=152367 RepID=A0AAP0KAE1_9MAGN
MDPFSVIATTVSILVAGLALVFLLVAVFAIVHLVFYAKGLMIQDQQAPIAGSIFNLLVHFNTLFDYQTYLARKHRTYRHVAPFHSEIYTVDPVNVEHILKTNFSNYGKGQYNHGIMKDLFGDGIFAVDGEKWRQQRKLASLEFSNKLLKNFSSTVFRVNAVKLVENISEVAASKKMMDLQDMLMKSTLDSIFKVGFGTELNSLSGLDEFGNRFTKAFDDSNVLVYWRFVDPFWKIKRFLNIGTEASLRRNIKLIDEFVFQVIRCKREQMKTETANRGKQDMLSRFLVESEKDEVNMTDQYLRDIILSFVIAGKDSSANTLTWFFYMLCKHPFVQEKNVQEVREATGMNDDTSVNEFAEMITEEVLDKMQYLHASLTETLRLYPAVPVDGKCSKEDDVLPDGLRVKKGDGINYMPYGMGRMTDIWGEDAEDFRPERWLKNGMFQPESPFKFTAFQAGPRICLGKEFAYRQMKILAAFLLTFFKFKLADETKEATYRTMFTLHMDQGLPLFAFHRLSKDGVGGKKCLHN